MKRTLYDKSPRSDRIYFLGDFPTSCNINTTGKSLGISAWLETPVLWKSVADVTQCEIHRSKSSSPGVHAAKRNPPVPNPQDCNLTNTHTPWTHLTLLAPRQSLLAKRVTLVFIFQYLFHFLALTMLER